MVLPPSKFKAMVGLTIALFPDNRANPSPYELDRAIHYPIKSLLADGTTTELTNIHEGLSGGITVSGA